MKIKNIRIITIMMLMVMLFSSISLGVVYADGDEIIADEEYPIPEAVPVSVVMDISHSDDVLEKGLVLDAAVLGIFDSLIGEIKGDITYNVEVSNGTIKEGGFILNETVFEEGTTKKIDGNKGVFTLNPKEAKDIVGGYGDLSLGLSVEVGDVADGEDFKIEAEVLVGDKELGKNEFKSIGGEPTFKIYEDAELADSGEDQPISDEEALEYNRSLGIEELDEEEIDELLEEEFERLDKEEEERDKALEESNKEFEEDGEDAKSNGVLKLLAILVVVFILVLVSVYTVKHFKGEDEE